jgi:hypothetical protein
MDFDNKSNFKTQSGFNAATIATDTTTAGNTIDTQGYGGLTFDCSVGVVTDGTYTPLIQDSDDDISYADVVDDFLIGTEADAALSASNTHTTIGYVGKKRYVKASYVSASTSSGATSCKMSAILGNPRYAPVVANA